MDLAFARITVKAKRVAIHLENLVDGSWPNRVEEVPAIVAVEPAQLHFLLSSSYIIRATPSRVDSGPVPSGPGDRHSRIVKVLPRTSTSNWTWSGIQRVPVRRRSDGSCPRRVLEHRPLPEDQANLSRTSKHRPLGPIRYAAQFPYLCATACSLSLSDRATPSVDRTRCDSSSAWSG